MPQRHWILSLCWKCPKFAERRRGRTTSADPDEEKSWSFQKRNILGRPSCSEHFFCFTPLCSCAQFSPMQQTSIVFAGFSCSGTSWHAADMKRRDTTGRLPSLEGRRCYLLTTLLALWQLTSNLTKYGKLKPRGKRTFLVFSRLFAHGPLPKLSAPSSPCQGMLPLVIVNFTWKSHN